MSRRANWREVAAGGAILAVVAVVGLYAARGQFQPRPWRHEHHIGNTFEAVDRSAVRITDGDTIRIGRERVRLLNIDAPEMPEHAHCQREIQLAYQARDFLRDRLTSAQRIEIARHDLDRYGRTLATVRVDGSDVGEQLIGAGLAQRWYGRHARWC